MLKQKVTTWLDSSLGKAQKAFEKKSGLSSRQLQSTLKSFSRLKTMDRVLLGGLVVGSVVKEGFVPHRLPKKKRVRKGLEASSR